MKKKILSFIIMLTVCAMACFSGCGLGSYIDSNGGNKNPSGTTKPDEPDVPDNPDNPDNPELPESPSTPEKHYTATVFYNNKLFDPADNEVKVVWKGDEIYRASLGSNGVADAGELDGDYGVYLEGLPDKYTYNPNTATATAENRKVTILLMDVKKPESGNGKGLYLDEGCYMVKYDGTYRAKITDDGEYLYYEYQPTASGYYSVVSWVNVYADEVNPLLRVYSGSTSYKYNPKDMNDGGFALPKGFTKNFRYECKVDAKEVGSSFTFAVSAAGKNVDYPLYVDFAITYEGDYISSNSDIRTIRAKEAVIRAEEKKAGEKYVYADEGTKVFDNSKYKFNDDTGFFHRYGVEYAADPYGYGVNFGPILCCSITKMTPCYSYTTLYEANATGRENGTNILRLYKVWIEEEKKYAVFDYTDFIRKDYYRVCNLDGVCYVTKELKAFLQKFAENQGLWTDGAGVSDGTPEDKGYYANQDALWLFACGYYKK